MNIEKFLASGVDKKKTLKAVKYFKEYFGEVSWEEVKRDRIHCMVGDECFRSYLDRKIKSDSSKNEVLRQLERLFDFLIMEKASEDGEMLENHFDLNFDKFKEEKTGGTKRQAISIEVVRLLRSVLEEEDFKFVRDLGEDYIDGVFNPSRAHMLWLILTLPLRSMQVRWLDKDLVLQERFMDGLSRKKVLGLYVNTNKNGVGFFIPRVGREIIEVIRRQIEFVGDSVEVLKEHGVKESVKVRLLFVNNYGEVVSREKLMKLWKKLCKEVFRRYGVKVDCDLHSLRVSLVSEAMRVIGEEAVVGTYLSGQTRDIVGHYYRVEQLEEKVRFRENEKNVGRLLQGSFKLLPQK